MLDCLPSPCCSGEVTTKLNACEFSRDEFTINITNIGAMYLCVDCSYVYGLLILSNYITDILNIPYSRRGHGADKKRGLACRFNANLRVST